jgi:hypothetical protein
MAARPKQRHEALAQLAETARTDQRKDRSGLVADAATAPIPTSSQAKDEAAAKVLREGATGEESGAEAAIDKLPDRILDSRRAATAPQQDEEAEWAAGDRGRYDATSDPRTGRPPLPIEAEALRKDHELQRLRDVQLIEGEEEIDVDAEEDDIDVILEDEEMADSGMIEDQEPGRMISPSGVKEEDGDDEADDYGNSR